jgi:hypothetical protein
MYNMFDNLTKFATKFEGVAFRHPLKELKFSRYIEGQYDTVYSSNRTLVCRVIFKIKTREDVAMHQSSKPVFGIMYNQYEIFICYKNAQRGACA